MKNLRDYVDSPLGINYWRCLQREALVDADNLTEKDAQDLFNSVAASLRWMAAVSETPAAAVRKREKYLKAVASELKALGFTPGHRSGI